MNHGVGRVGICGSLILELVASSLLKFHVSVAILVSLVLFFFILMRLYCYCVFVVIFFYFNKYRFGVMLTPVRPLKLIRPVL